MIANSHDKLIVSATAASSGTCSPSPPSLQHARPLMERKPSLPACSTDHGPRTTMQSPENKPRIGRMKRSSCWKLHLNPSVSLFSLADADNNHRLIIAEACWCSVRATTPVMDGSLSLTSYAAFIYTMEVGGVGALDLKNAWIGMGGQQNGRWS